VRETEVQVRVGRQVGRQTNFPYSNTERFAGGRGPQQELLPCGAVGLMSSCLLLLRAPRSHTARDSPGVVTLKPHQSGVYAAKRKTTQATKGGVSLWWEG